MILRSKDSKGACAANSLAKPQSRRNAVPARWSATAPLMPEAALGSRAARPQDRVTERMYQGAQGSYSEAEESSMGMSEGGSAVALLLLELAATSMNQHVAAAVAVNVHQAAAIEVMLRMQASVANIMITISTHTYSQGEDDVQRW